MERRELFKEGEEVIGREAKKAKPWSRKTARVLKRMGWKWKPEPGEWACWRRVRGGISEPELITHYNGRHVCLHKMGPLPQIGLVPVLSWTRIVEILERMGYNVWIEKHCDLEFTCVVTIKSDEISEQIVCRTKAKTCQEAVTLATIGLEKKEKLWTKVEKGKP